MAFDRLRKLLGDDAPYTEQPVAIPGTSGLDPSAPPQKFLGGILDKYAPFTDTPATDNDSVRPDYNSPVDILAGAAGAKLGGAMARDAGSILGNEAGAINPKPSAKFIGYQETGDGHMPLFNIEGDGHPLNGSTVSSQTLAKQGIAEPAIPSVDEHFALLKKKLSQ